MGEIENDLVARLNEAAIEIDNDGTPSQVGPTSDECRQAASLLTTLQAERERQWCLSCGTVTRDETCDCTNYTDAGHQNLVNYGDEMRKQGLSLLRRAEAAEADRDRLARELEEAREALKPFAFRDMCWRHGDRVTVTVAIKDIDTARSALSQEGQG